MLVDNTSSKNIILNCIVGHKAGRKGTRRGKASVKKKTVAAGEAAASIVSVHCPVKKDVVVQNENRCEKGRRTTLGKEGVWQKAVPISGKVGDKTLHVSRKKAKKRVKRSHQDQERGKTSWLKKVILPQHK